MARSHKTNKAPAWRRYVRFWGNNLEDDVDEELRFHLDMRINEYVARGMPLDEARRLAERRFGSVDGAHTACVDIQDQHARSVGRAELASMIAHDFPFAAR